MFSFKEYFANPDLITRIEQMFAVKFTEEGCTALNTEDITHSLLAEAAPGAQLFHKDIGIPAPAERPAVGLVLNYGRHAREEAIKDNLRAAPKRLPAYELIEVEVVAGRSTKWVVRFPLKDEDRDLVLVVLPDGFVKTLWTNQRTDTHKTLKRHLYTPPNQFRAA